MNESNEHGLGWRKLIVRLMAISVVILLSAMIYWAFQQIRFELRLSRIRANGEPTSIADVASMRKPPADEDCTTLWLEAMQLFSEDWYSLPKEDMERYLALPCIDCGSPIPTITERWSDLQTAVDCLNSQARALSLADQASKKGGKASLPRKRGEHDFGMIQEQDDLRMICWLLELRTVVELHQRAPAKAARSIQTLLSVVHAIENQPTFVSTLTTNKYQQAAYRLSAELCSDPGVSNDPLVQLQRSLESQDLLAQARWGFASERAFCIELFLRCPPAPPYWNERNQYLDAMEELDVMCDDGWPSLVEMSRTGTEPGRFGPLTTMARDAWLRSLPSIARIETLRRLTIVALAARRFVNDSHRLPESISDLVPTYLETVPKDILEKEPVSLSATDDIMTISSYAPSKGDESDSDSKSTAMSLQVHLPPTVAH